MDHQSKHGSSSHKGRGRGSRSQPGPSQFTRPQHPNQPYYPQPPNRTQIPTQPYYPQPPNQNLYPLQPQPQPQYFQNPPPMNPANYNILMTNEFNPFNEYRDGRARREPSVERQLPIYDNEDDEIEFVPETQFTNTTGKVY